MKVSRFTCLAAATGLVMLLAGCGSADSADRSPTLKSLQLRTVVSEVDKACTAPPVTSDAAAEACDQDGATTYRLAASLGTVTPTSAELSDDQSPAQSIALQFDETDSGVLAAATRKAINERLAILLDGTVLTAPQVMDPITSGEVTLAFDSSATTRAVNDQLRAAGSDE